MSLYCISRLAISAWVLVCSLALGQNANQKPRQLTNVGLNQRINQAVPLDLPFADEAGRTVKLGDYFHGKPVVLTPVYYQCPMLCTMELNGLLKALRVLSFSAGQEFEVVTVSFDPKETPALAASKKAQYMEKYRRASGAQGWHFLTGPAASIQALTRSIGFRYEWDPVGQVYSHPSAITVLTPDGRVSRYLLGIEYSGRELKLALTEAGAGKIGTPLDQVVLYCFHYDPATGQYTLSIMKIVRLAGLLTVLCLLAGILFLWAKDRRRRKLVTQYA